MSNNNTFKIITGLNKNGQSITSLYKVGVNGTTFTEPVFLKMWEEPTPEEIENEKMLNDWSRWNEKLIKDEIIEVSGAIFYDMLGCLPPHKMEGNYFEVGEPNHHDNKGRAIYRAFYYENGKYYTCYPKGFKTISKSEIKA